jgi:hypothetical protein
VGIGLQQQQVYFSWACLTSCAQEVPACVEHMFHRGVALLCSLVGAVSKQSSYSHIIVAALADASGAVTPAVLWCCRLAGIICSAQHYTIVSLKPLLLQLLLFGAAGLLASPIAQTAQCASVQWALCCASTAVSGCSSLLLLGRCWWCPATAAACTSAHHGSRLSWETAGRQGLDLRLS